MAAKLKRILEKDLKTKKFWKAILGEFIATFFFITIIVSTTFGDSENREFNNLHMALSSCFTVSVLISAFFDISGGHFNPAISLTFLLMGKISIVRFCCYVVAQSIGSIAGCGFLHLITPNEYHGGFGVMSLHPDIQPGIGFLIEVFLGSLLMLTVVTCTDPDRDFNGFQAPFAIGVTVAVLSLVGAPFNGVSLNPIRPLGPAIIKKQFDKIWIWMIGPLLSSLVTVFVYRIFLKCSAHDSECNQDIIGENDEKSQMTLHQNEP